MLPTFQNAARTGLAAGCAVLLVGAGTACGSEDKGTPKSQAQQAIKAVGEDKALTVKLFLDADATEIGTALSGRPDFTKADGRLLADLDLTLSASADKPLNEALKDAAADKGKANKDKLQSAAALTTGNGQNLVEVRAVDGTVYARADLKAVAGLAKDTTGKDAALDQLLSGAEELPDSLSSVKDAVAGKWVSIDPKEYQEFSEQMEQSQGGSGGGTVDPDAVSPETQRTAMKALTSAFSKNTTYKDAGSKDGVDHITASANAKDVAEDLKAGLEPIEDQLPDSFKMSKLDDAPDKTVKADLAVKDEELESITVDLAQFDPQIDAELPLKLDFDNSAEPVTKPGSSTPLKPQDVMGAVVYLRTNTENA
jgi:hypothetical protein